MNRLYEQEYAAFALECVNKVAEEDDTTKKKKYRTVIRGLGPAIISSGLGQALATLAAREGKKCPGATALLQNIREWLGAKKENEEKVEDAVHPKSRLFNRPGMSGTSALFEYLNSMDRTQYNMVRIEILNLLEWMAKYAVAILPKPDEDVEAEPEPSTTQPELNEVISKDGVSE